MLRTVAQPGDGEADGQREVAAGVEQPGDGVLVGRDPFGAEDPVQQGPPLGRAEVGEFDPLGPFADDEAGEAVAAGHDHRAAPRAGQQRADLFGVERVVEHDQDPSAGQGGAVERGRLVEPTGYVLGRHAQCPQERAEDGVRVLRAGGRPSVQVREELTVGEVLPGAVRPAHRQGRLAAAGDAGDHEDGRRERAAGAGAADTRGAGSGQVAVHGRELGGTTDEEG